MPDDSVSMMTLTRPRVPNVQRVTMVHRVHHHVRHVRLVNTVVQPALLHVPHVLRANTKRVLEQLRVLNVYLANMVLRPALLFVLLVLLVNTLVMLVVPLVPLASSVHIQAQVDLHAAQIVARTTMPPVVVIPHVFHVVPPVKPLVLKVAVKLYGIE